MMGCFYVEEVMFMKIKEIETDDLSYSELLKLMDDYSGTIYYHVFERAIDERIMSGNARLHCAARRKRKFDLHRPKCEHTRYFVK